MSAASNDGESDDKPGQGADAGDAAHWDAVEDAVEVLHAEDYHAALLLLRDVVKNDPRNPYAFHFIGVALFEIGELEPARDAYRAALRLAPSHLGARVALSHVLRMLGDTRGAVTEGLVALSQAPGDGDSLHAIGMAYLTKGDHSAAKKYLLAFLDTKPEFEVATEVRGLLSEM